MLEEPAHSLGGCLDPEGCAEAAGRSVQPVRGGGHEETLTAQAGETKAHAEPGACVTERKNIISGTFRVIPFAPRATGVQAPAGLPASHWEADSLGGGGFPCKADCVLTKSIFPGFWGPCPMAAEPAPLAEVT